VSEGYASLSITGGNPLDETEPDTRNGDADVNPDDVPF
jgi:hypothetical protein